MTQYLMVEGNSAGQQRIQQAYPGLIVRSFAKDYHGLFIAYVCFSILYGFPLILIVEGDHPSVCWL